MKLSALFLTLIASASFGTAAIAQTIARTPLAAPIEMTGTTGGVQESACGNINPNQSQVVRVTESFASLSFQVESQGDFTLLITGPDGFRECVFAHNYDGGVIEAPGLLTQGDYQVYVGDRSGGSYPYTLSISQ